MKNEVLLDLRERSQRALDGLPKLVFDGGNLREGEFIVSSGQVVESIYRAREEVTKVRDMLHAEPLRKTPQRGGGGSETEE